VSDLDFWAAFVTKLGRALKLEEYFIADWLYLLVLMTAVLCLWRGHRAQRIDLWDTIRTKKGEVTYTDPRKLFEVGAFVVMSCGFSYMVIQGKLTEWYAGIYVTAFVAARYLRDREQRLNRQLEIGASNPAAPAAPAQGKP